MILPQRQHLIVRMEYDEAASPGPWYLGAVTLGSPGSYRAWLLLRD